MTPAFHEADYYLALRRARRAWEASQPQYVIPGFWDGLDDASLTARRLVGVAGKPGGRDASSSPCSYPPIPPRARARPNRKEL